MLICGGPDNDGVGTKNGGRFSGNVGNDYVSTHNGGPFIGGFEASFVSRGLASLPAWVSRRRPPGLRPR